MQAKIRAFDKNVKEINTNGQKLAQSTFIYQECRSRSRSRWDSQPINKESIAKANESEEPKHTEENKHQDNEHEQKLLNCRVSRKQSELSAKTDV